MVVKAKALFPMELYLIAHKVRGEPAFDIATCEEVEGEEMWIIPTSGHRAYPYWCVQILIFGDTLTLDGDEEGCVQLEAMMPDGLRDHYTTSASPRTATAGRDILSTIGLLKPAEPIKRRI